MVLADSDSPSPSAKRLAVSAHLSLTLAHCSLAPAASTPENGSHQVTEQLTPCGPMQRLMLRPHLPGVSSRTPSPSSLGLHVSPSLVNLPILDTDVPQGTPPSCVPRPPTPFSSPHPVVMHDRQLQLRPLLEQHIIPPDCSKGIKSNPPN